MVDRNPRKRRRRRRRSRGERVERAVIEERGADAASDDSTDAASDAPSDEKKQGKTRRGERVKRGGSPPGTILGMPRFLFIMGAGLAVFFVVILVSQQILGPVDLNDIGEVVRVPDQGRRHLTADEEFTAYNSLPATSGPQPAVGAAPGIYGPDEPEPFSTIPPPADFLPMLERGGMVIYYDPAVVTDRNLDALRARVERLLEGPRIMALVPLQGLADNALPLEARAPVVATAWRHLLAIRTLDEEGTIALAEFTAADPTGYYGRFILDDQAQPALSAAE